MRPLVSGSEQKRDFGLSGCTRRAYARIERCIGRSPEPDLSAADVMNARVMLVSSVLGGAALQLVGPLPAAGQAPAPDAKISGCAPQQRGEGAIWLTPCQRAAESGDGQAALIVGAIHWNGDGVAKDNAAAARWWKMADEAGRAEAARLLGDEAFVRITAGAGDPAPRRSRGARRSHHLVPQGSRGRTKPRCARSGRGPAEAGTRSLKRLLPPPVQN
jgi:hypothetical protein